MPPAAVDCVNGAHSPTKLEQPVGLGSLTAIALNGIIGAAIFVLPSTLANFLGPASPSAYVIAWLATILVGLCFAKLGSMFDVTGGPYVYARRAFGDFVGFEIGWLFLLARLTAVSAITSGFTAYLGYFWPKLSFGIGRVVAATVLLALLATINLLGVRYGAWVINLLTIGKLLPLAIFISVGVFFVHSQSYSFSFSDLGSLQKASLVLIFAFGGFEYASVPSEEVINPRRVTPIALLTAITLTAFIYILIQIIVLSTVSNLSATTTPLSTAARQFLGPLGGAVLTLGAILSTTGTNSAAMLVGPRMLYALSAGGQLPGALARVHQHYRTPYVSIALFAVVAWAFAMYSSFTQLASLSAIARLLYYASTCLAVPLLCLSNRRSGGIGFWRELVVPVLGTLICLWLLTASSPTQLVLGSSALLLGAIVYWWNKRFVR